MLKDYEKFLQEKVLPELELGRPGWDRPHTISVVNHLDAIILTSPQLQLDTDVLKIAAYTHDWGYSGLFKNDKPVTFNAVNDVKAEHMRVGALKLRNLLKKPVFDFLSEIRKGRAIHLVSVHDDLDNLRDFDELVLMEADTLGGLDITGTKPTFDRGSNDIYMERVRRRRLPLFITEYGTMMFEKLYRERQEFYANLREPFE